MTDIINKKRRSWNMSRIRSTNTQPEITVRSFLHRNGFRFRLHQKSIYGRPDIVLKKYKTVIFIDGCFWHRHKDCTYAYTPKSRIDFWNNKFESNIKRDKKVNKSLKNEGWNLIRIWECETEVNELLKSKIIYKLI
jgi:DNA mismatch endonuclease (patch repair protein)|tara:strand:+ start:58 stop:465 length:408 start_codon:yes stop_codon:yes gene_type:complete